MVLFHGLSGSPFSLKGIAEVYRKLGFDVFAPLLDGHGTHQEDLRAVKLEDWRKKVDETLEEVLSNYSRLALGGFSLGGALALDALDRNAEIRSRIDHLLLVAPFFHFQKPWIEKVVPFLRYFPIYSQKEVEGRPFSYDQIAVAAVAESVGLIKKVRKNWVSNFSIKNPPPIGVVMIEDDQTVSNEWIERFISQTQTQKVLRAEKSLGLAHRDLACDEIYEEKRVNPVLDRYERLISELASSSV